MVLRVETALEEQHLEGGKAPAMVRLGVMGDSVLGISSRSEWYLLAFRVDPGKVLK